MRPYLLSLAATRTRLILLTQGLSPQGRWAGRQLILSAVSLLASLSPDAAQGAEAGTVLPVSTCQRSMRWAVWAKCRLTSGAMWRISGSNR